MQPDTVNITGCIVDSLLYYIFHLGLDIYRDHLAGQSTWCCGLCIANHEIIIFSAKNVFNNFMFLFQPHGEHCGRELL